MNEITRMVVLLVMPTNYDSKGYPLRFRKGVFPSNSLAILAALTERAFKEGELATLSHEVRVFDESIWSMRIDNPAKLVEKYQDGKTKIVVGLVGVQTRQFPRACDLAHAFKEAGALVVIGGFHVSGVISTMYDGISSFDPKRKNVPCPKVMPEEVGRLMDAGITVFHGEAEDCWHEVLKDILHGEQQRLYRGGTPNLAAAPFPLYPEGYFSDFVTTQITMDTSRGCPFKCSFCAIINVQGREMRIRDPRQIASLVRKECEKNGRADFFLTDDNFGRNPHWETILDLFIGLREQGSQIRFVVEADLAMCGNKKFVQKLAQAGCTQVFMGIESLNQEVLCSQGKVQNQVSKYKDVCDLFHEQGISMLFGYIIGFPNETRKTILEDVEQLKEIGANQVSFFILMPLPGSENHVRMVKAGIPMEEDLNRYNSFEMVMDHPNMSRQELENVFFECFRRFYSPDQMVRVLRRVPEEKRGFMLRQFLWYRNSIRGEKLHPMGCGIWSVRKRTERRPGQVIDNFFAFWAKELWFRTKYFAHLLREFYVFQHVYFQSQLEPKAAERLSRGLSGPVDWFKRTFRLPAARSWLNNFWIQYGRQKWELLKPWRWDWHFRMIPYAITEVIYTLRFINKVMLREEEVVSVKQLSSHC